MQCKHEEWNRGWRTRGKPPDPSNKSTLSFSIHVRRESRSSYCSPQTTQLASCTAWVLIYMIAYRLFRNSHSARRPRLAYTRISCTTCAARMLNRFNVFNPVPDTSHTSPSIVTMKAKKSLDPVISSCRQKLPMEDLNESERWWADRREILERAGYQLRARFQPDWKPSWVDKNCPVFECEDALTRSRTYVSAFRRLTLRGH
jgi:hypothetical protein